MIPCRNLGTHLINAWNAVSEALALQDAGFDFRYIQPTSMLGGAVDFQPLRQLLSFG